MLRMYPDSIDVCSGRAKAVRQVSLITPCLALLSSAVTTAGVWIERSRSRCVLATLNDEQLRDIGLTRADVRDEIAKPFWLL